MKHFVLEYNHDTGKMVSLVQFDEHDKAAARWRELKALHAEDADDADEVEAMLASATSIDALKAACPQYFGWAQK